MTLVQYEKKVSQTILNKNVNQMVAKNVALFMDQICHIFGMELARDFHNVILLYYF